MAQFSVKIIRLTGSVLGENQQTASILRSRWTPTETSRVNLHGKRNRSLQIQQEGGARTALTDQQEFYQLLSYTGDVDLNAKLAEWEKFYNFARPHGAHNGKTPYEALREKL